MLEDTQFIWNLQRANKISQSFSTSLEINKIASLATEGLVRHFDCAFARIWLVEPDSEILKLVASSGLYTHLNGSYSRIPIGEFKIGKIAQNRITLLSNNLASESWVRDPEWAIANHLTSFVGYPLANEEKAIGVLAAFSTHPMKPEFLEVLLSLCTTLTVALEMAAQHKNDKPDVEPKITLKKPSLSEHISAVLKQTKLTILGTERSLSFPQSQIFLKIAEILQVLDCSYCRLTYEVDSVGLEAIAQNSQIKTQDEPRWERDIFGHLFSIVSCFGGSLTVNTKASIQAIQVSLQFPSLVNLPELSLRIQCHHPLLQMGLTQLAYCAGLKVDATNDSIPLLTDRKSLLETNDRIIWVNHNSNTIPSSVKATIDVSATSTQLREAVEAVTKGENWGLDRHLQVQKKLSHRERQVMALLAQGLRDREIAEHLHISDSTVKFHMNNVLAKLQAKTRLQALYRLMKTDGLEL